MAIIRWDPFREMTTLQNHVNRLADSLWSGRQESWVPAVDVFDSKDAVVLKAELPGMKVDDIRIEVDDNVLTISGERKSEHEESKQGYYRVERSSGSFSRALTLPEGVDPEAVKANFDRGVLEVRIPKPEQRKPVKVAINVGGGKPAEVIEGAGSEPAAA